MRPASTSRCAGTAAVSRWKFLNSAERFSFRSCSADCGCPHCLEQDDFSSNRHPAPALCLSALGEQASASRGRRGCERIALVRNMLDINGDCIACRECLSQRFIEKLVDVPPSALRLLIRLVATRHGLRDSSGPSRDAFPARSPGDRWIWSPSAHPANWRSPRSLPAAARRGLLGVAQAVEPANPTSPLFPRTTRPGSTVG